METLTWLIREDLPQDGERLFHQIEAVLDDEGWEFDVEFTPDCLDDLPQILMEFLENETVSPEARLQLEILGRLVKRGAFAAGRAVRAARGARKRVQRTKKRFGQRKARFKSRIKSRVKRARGSLRKSFRAGMKRSPRTRPARLRA